MQKSKLIVLLLILFYIVYFTLVGFLRFDNFYAGRFDLGNMDQTVWNTAHGRIFQLTDPNGTEIISRLAFHADFILILLAPFYFIWENAKMLLLIQSSVIGFGAFFVYLISQKILKNNLVSVILSVTYLLNPALQHSNLYDFHAVTLATTFLLAAFYFFLEKRYFLFLLLVILSALTKEQVWTIASLFGLYLFIPQLISLIKKKVFVKKELLIGIALFVLSLLIFYTLVWKAIPNARGGNHFALSYYSEFGTSPGNIIKNIILSPGKTLNTFLQPDRLEYLKQIFLPLGYLPLLSPLILIFAAPDLMINLLSNNSQLHQIFYQYTATITPFLFIAAIYSIKQLKNLFPKIPFTVFSLFLILSSLFSSIEFGPLPFSKSPNILMLTKPLTYRSTVENFLATIGEDKGVAATNNLGAHLSHRQRIYTIPTGLNKADYIVFLLNDPTAQPSLDAQIKMAGELEENKNYIELYRLEDFVVFKKK